MSRQLIRVLLLLFVALSARRVNASAVNGCDLNSDGVVNVADVQLSIDQALGTLACTNGDLNDDGHCTVADVQLEIIAALGGGCKPAQSTTGVCAVTSPTATSAQSGVVTWTATLTSLPSAASVDWVFDDFRVIGHATAAPWSLANYNTGWNLDGPGNVKIIVRDATGAAICTSADVPFTTNNFGMGIVINSASSAGGAINLQQLPTVSGTLTIDISGNFPNDVSYANDAIDGIQNFAKISPGATYPTGPTFHLQYDTTQMVNGLHSFGWSIECLSSSTNCGMPNTASPYTGGVPRAFVGAVINVQNPAKTVVGVQMNITDMVMAAGDTFQLTPLLLYADGSTATCTTCSYVQDNSCLFQITSDPQLPFQCVTGNTNATLNTSEGANYVTVSSAGLVTAVSQGLSYVSAIDGVSGRASNSVAISVKASKNVPHYGSCGTIYAAYNATGNCPSILVTSLENFDALANPTEWPDIVKSGYTAFEGQFHTSPHTACNGGVCSTFSAFQSAWQNEYHTPINQALAAMPGLSMILRGENIFQQPLDTVEVEQGASAPAPLGGNAYAGCGNTVGSGACDPLGYELDQLAATGRIVEHHPRDESDAGLGFNLNYSYKMVTADGSTRGLSSITVSGCPTSCQATFAAQGEFQMYGGNSRMGGDVIVRNATNTSLNGHWTTTNSYYCTEWNAILQYNGAGSRDGDCASNPSHQNTWIATPGTGACTSGCQNGTYTFSGGTGNTAEPTAEVLGWGNFTGYGGETMLNDNYSFAVSKFQSHNIPTSWCTRAGADFTTDLSYQGNSLIADGFCSYASYNDYPTLPSGRTFWEYYATHYAIKWGNYNYSSKPSTTCCQWRRDSKSYSTTRQGVPATVLAGVNAETFVLGGRYPGCPNQRVACTNQSGSMSDGILTLTGPHGVVQGSGSFAEIKLVITNSSDTSFNGNWNAAPTGVNSFRVYGQVNNCSPAPPPYGTVTIQSGKYNGNSYTILGTGGYYGELYMFDNPMPGDILPGTLMQITGAGNSACNQTFAFANYQIAGSCTAPGMCLYLSNIASSTGSNATVLVNDDQGQFNPLYDFNNLGNGRFGGGGASGFLLQLAGWGYAGLKLYQAVGTTTQQGIWDAQWPNNKDAVGFQSTPLPGTNEWLNFQQRWWDISQGLNFIKRLAPFYLQTLGPSPLIGPGPPRMSATLATSSAYGNILTTVNFSEMPITATFNLGTLCQVGSNPISVYHASFPHATTELLTGSQSTVTYTWDAGEAIVFACHASSASFVQPYSIAFNSPAGTVNTVVTAVHGNYSGPIGQYFQSSSGTQTGRATVCTGSPCSIKIDTGASDVYYNLTYLNSNNAVISTTGPIDIPKAP